MARPVARRHQPRLSAERLTRVAGDDDDRIGVPRDRIAGIGSERLALALANHDVLGVGQALRHDYVVVPLTREGEGDSKLLVTAFIDDEGRQRFELPLFSSAQTLALFSGTEQNTEFAVRLGSTLAPVLEQNASVLDRVRFDPAGPHPMTASAEDVLASLQPRLGDDDVAWAASSGSAIELDQILSAAQEHPVAIDIRLPVDWQPVDLELPEIEQTAQHFYPRRFAKSNRLGMERFISAVLAAARKMQARFLAVTVVPVDGEPLGVALSTTWHEIGPAIGDVSHLDRMAERLGGHEATSPSGRYLRVTGDRPLVEYWLEFPDQRGLATIAFSMSSGTASPALLEMTDRIAESATWVS
jgi:hypothetical protein